MAEVKGETKNVSSSKYLSGAKTCTLPLPSRDMCRRDRADTVGAELRDWAEINPVSVCDQKKAGGRNRVEPATLLLAKHATLLQQLYTYF